MAHTTRGKRVSSDRLIRVRATQPFSSTASSHSMKVAQHNDNTPIAESKIQIGDFCVFKSGVGSNWNNGKVLQFSKYKSKRLKDQEYKGFSADMTDQSICVLCAWFIDSGSLLEFHLKSQLTNHIYIPVSNYICTLTRKCFEIIGKASFGISSLESINQEVVAADKIKLTTQCQAFVLDLMQKSGTTKKSLEVAITDHKDKLVYVSDEEPCEDECSDEDAWVTFGRVTLRMSDREILLNANGLLNDKHIFNQEQISKCLWAAIYIASAKESDSFRT